MGGRQSINLCVHILGPQEAGAGWQPRQRDAGAAGTRATGGRPRRPWQRSPSSQHSATHLPPLPGHPSCPTAPRGNPQRGAGQGPGAAARGPGAGWGPPERHPRPPQRRPQRRTMRGRPATHLSRGRAGCPPGPRLPGALWDRDSGMPATGKGTGRVRVTGAWRAPGLVGLRRETVACRRAASYRRAPVSAAARPLPRASPARKARGRAELPRAAPAPARPLARPLAWARAAHRRSPPLQLLGLRAQPARPARLDGRLESAARPAAAEAAHRLEAGRRRAGKKLHGCWWVSFSVISTHSFGVLREN